MTPIIGISISGRRIMAIAGLTGHTARLRIGRALRSRSAWQRGADPIQATDSARQVLPHDASPLMGACHRNRKK